MKNHYNWHKLLYVLLLAIFLVSVAFNVFSANKIIYMDERDYLLLSENIATYHQYIGENLQSTAYRPPLYPFLLSLFSWVGSNKVMALKILNSIFLVMTAFLYGLITCERENQRGQLICVVLIAVYPLFYFTSSLLYPQIFGAMLFALISLLLLKADFRQRHLIIATFLYGFLILAIPLFVLAMPLIALFLFIDPKAKKRSAKLINPIIFCFLSSLIVLCWSARNYYVFNKFIPIATNSGFNLFVGNNKNADYNTGTVVDWNEHAKAINELNLNEYEKDVYFRNQAIQWVKSNPGDAIKLYFKKVLNYFNYTNQLFVEEQGSRFKDAVMFLSYMPLLLISIVRLFFIGKAPLSRMERYLYLVYFGMAFMSALFFTRLRFRVPLDFCLIAIVSIAFSKLFKSADLANRESTKF